MRFISIIAFIFLFLSSCSFFQKKKSADQDKGKILAEVHKNYLYEVNLEGILPDRWGNDKDSNQVYMNFVKSWVKEQLIFHKALANLTTEEKDMQEELDQYYHSLIKYKYREKIVEQRLDRNVSDEEILNYFNENSEAFTLKRCIIRLIFFHLPTNSPELSKVKKWYLSSEVSDLDLLHQYCVIHATKYNLDDSKWFYADDIMSDIPFDINLCEIKDRSLELADSSLVYFINISEIKKTGSISPLEFEKERIKHTILHNRRIDLIKKVENRIFNEGIEKNYFVIYD